MKLDVPENHPRAQSLRIRERIIDGMHKNIVAEAGLIAHGRGEAFDYLIGEETPNFAEEQQQAAVALILRAQKPVFSVNGNVASLCPNEIVEISELLNIPLEVNLFYRREERAKIVADKLVEAGAEEVLGVDPEYHKQISELTHSRRVVDKRGIYSADVVFVPLEDGDRTMALRKLGKQVITVDLNPLSRTSIWSSITIVNNIVRSIPEMIEIGHKLKGLSLDQLSEILNSYDNDKSLRESLEYISNRLKTLSKTSLKNLQKK
ncbi:MAG: phosphopantothenate/pantothenate synthetase [Candidatus Heimdallarchaeota archaeon]|nr:phosphopantothenate/pantothenate synthetase [Candidatus Heimdallarchaeota archaeon]